MLTKYKRFLYLLASRTIDDDVPRVVPTRALDRVWHHHILDTKKYAADCAALGGFLHHFPQLRDAWTERRTRAQRGVRDHGRPLS